MQVRLYTLIPLAASGLVLMATLSSPAMAVEDKEFGCTVKHNVQVQTVDMDPKYAGTLMEGGLGQRSSAAVRRYMTDKVRPLLRTDGRSQVGAQGGGGGGGGSGGGGN
jgi:uncharacterized membrane protein YgcG